MYASSAKAVRRRSSRGIRRPAGAPTVLLYAHHDVQPEGDPSQWVSPPFEPTERNGRLYGRGSADDKAGIATHLAAFRAHGGQPPVGVTVFVEGEEESGSPSLGRLLAAHRDALAADVIVIADSDNWSVDIPALTVSLRGLVDCVVEVATLDHGLHSGIWGGVLPDALSVLVRLLASLHDDDGNVAVAGLHETDTAGLNYPDYPAERVRTDSGVLDGVSEIGSGSVPQRLWAKPAITVIGIDTTSVAAASNTLIPRARAKISMRVAPGGDAEAHLDALTAHLQRHAPWGAQVTVTRGEIGEPYAIEASGAVYDAARAAFRQAWGADADRHGDGRLDPVHRRVRRRVPAGENPRHRGGRPRDTGAQRQRKPASGCAGTRRDRRSAAAGQPGLIEACSSARASATTMGIGRDVRFWYSAYVPLLTLLTIFHSRSYSGSPGRRGRAVALKRFGPTLISTSG